jgi:hypothetical protein
MKPGKRCMLAVGAALALFVALSSWAQSLPTPREGSWVVKDFRFSR